MLLKGALNPTIFLLLKDTLKLTVFMLLKVALKLHVFTLLKSAQNLTVFVLLTGALNLTREAYRRSIIAQEAADATERDVADSERQCKRTETLVNRTATQFSKIQAENKDALDTLSEKLKELEIQIPDLNELVSVLERSKHYLILCLSEICKKAHLTCTSDYSRVAILGLPYLIFSLDMSCFWPKNFPCGQVF